MEINPKATVVFFAAASAAITALTTLITRRPRRSCVIGVVGGSVLTGSAVLIAVLDEMLRTEEMMRGGY